MCKLMTLLFVMLAVLSVAACGGDSGGKDAKATTTTTDKDSTTSTTSPGDAFAANQNDYPDDYVDLGVSGCVQRGGNDEGVCRCFFNGIFTTVDFEVMKAYGVKIDAATQAGTDPNEVEKPTEVATLAEDCSYQFVV